MSIKGPINYNNVIPAGFQISDGQCITTESFASFNSIDADGNDQSSNIGKLDDTKFYRLNLTWTIPKSKLTSSCTSDLVLKFQPKVKFTINTNVKPNYFIFEIHDLMDAGTKEWVASFTTNKNQCITEKSFPSSLVIDSINLIETDLEHNVIVQGVSINKEERVHWKLPTQT